VLAYARANDRISGLKKGAGCSIALDPGFDEDRSKQASHHMAFHHIHSDLRHAMGKK